MASRDDYIMPRPSTNAANLQKPLNLISRCLICILLNIIKTSVEQSFLRHNVPHAIGCDNLQIATHA